MFVNSHQPLVEGRGIVDRESIRIQSKVVLNGKKKSTCAKGREKIDDSLAHNDASEKIKQNFCFQDNKVTRIRLKNSST
jgi:hypothetical protein